MKRTLHAVEVGTAAQAAERALPEEVQLSLVEIAGAAKEGLLAFAVGNEGADAANETQDPCVRHAQDGYSRFCRGSARADGHQVSQRTVHRILDERGLLNGRR